MTELSPAARQFLYEGGFTDKDGQLLPHFQSIDQGSNEKNWTSGSTSRFTHY